MARPLLTTLPTTTTPKPPNYVYVRGKLKTLAEIAAEQAIEDTGVPQHPQVSTPPPPFDELGYPSRNIDDNSHNQPILFDFPRTTAPKVTTKPYIESKYTTNYNPNIYAKKKEKYPAVYPTTLTRPYSHGEQNLIQPSPTPISSIVFPDDPKQSHNGNGGVYYPDNYTRQKAGILRPSYFNGGLNPVRHGPLQAQPQLNNFQPNQLRYQQNNVNRQNLQQQNQQNQNENNEDLPLFQRPNSGFRPAFPPPQNQQLQRARAQILFPGPTNQSQFPFNPLFQLPQNQGYYSPITQYRQPLDQSLNVQQNPFYSSQSGVPPGSNYNLNNNHFNNGLPQFFQPQQFFPPQYQQQIQPSYNPAHANYIQQSRPQSQQQQQQPAAVPLHQDILVNYR